MINKVKPTLCQQSIHNLFTGSFSEGVQDGLIPMEFGKKAGSFWSVETLLKAFRIIPRLTHLSFSLILVFFRSILAPTKPRLLSVRLGIIYIEPILSSEEI